MQKENPISSNKCNRISCDFSKHDNIKNNGGTHCCLSCKQNKGHGPFCKKSSVTENTDCDIDAVVTWADGTDPLFIRDRQNAVGFDKIDPQTKHLDKRDEVLYCLRGLSFNCPWLRTIYLVTNDQWPNFFDEELAGLQKPPIIKVLCKNIHPNKINVYGSTTIEPILHKIPGLSDLFLYANCDMFIGKPMKKDEWVKDGIGLFKIAPYNRVFTANSTSPSWWDRFAHIEQIKLFESKFPKSSIYKQSIHQVQIMSKEAFHIAETTYPELFIKTINTNGRMSEPHIGRMLIEYISLSLGLVKFDPVKDKDLKLTHDHTNLTTFIPKLAAKLICINRNDANLGEAGKKMYYDFLNKTFPEKMNCEINKI
jgi:hypothetical protein